MAPLSDEQLFALLEQDPATAFRSLYDRYAGPLLRFVYRFTEDQACAEDILHDVFSELLNGKFKKEEGAKLKNWLFTVARNKSLNGLRRTCRERPLTDADTARSDSDLEESTGHVLALGQLRLMEAQLPPEFAETWGLRKQGYNYKEIAKQLAIPLGTVKSRLSRLVDYLKGEFDL